MGRRLSAVAIIFTVLLNLLIIGGGVALATSGPSITLMLPGQLTLGETATLTVTATLYENSPISSVDFLYQPQGTSDWLPIGSGTTSDGTHFNGSWQPSQPGNYAVKAVATDQNSLKGEAIGNISVASPSATPAPVVSLTVPTSVQSGSDVPLSVTASLYTGTSIQTVRFAYQPDNGSPPSPGAWQDLTIGTAQSYTWPAPANGQYWVLGEVKDSNNQIGGDVKSVTITSPPPPTSTPAPVVTLTVPTNVQAGTDVPLSVTASLYTSATIQEVRFAVQPDTGAPADPTKWQYIAPQGYTSTSYTWMKPPGGKYLVLGEVIDSYGVHGSDVKPLSVPITGPAITLQMPTNGAVGQAIQIGATPQPGGSAVTSVLFESQLQPNGPWQTISTDSNGSDGFTATWTPSTAGTYSVRATGTDQNNLTGSANATITVGSVQQPGGIILQPAQVDQGYTGTITATNFGHQNASDFAGVVDLLKLPDQTVVSGGIAGNPTVTTDLYGPVVSFNLSSTVVAGNYDLAFHFNDGNAEHTPLQVLAPANVVITTVDAVGNPYQGMLQIRPALADSSVPSTWQQTDQKGVARLQLPAGDYVLVDIGNQDGVVRMGTKFTAPSSGQLQLTVKVIINVKATILDASGNPMPRAQVGIKQDDGTGKPVSNWDNVYWGSTNDSGVLATRLPAGNYHVVQVGSTTGMQMTDIAFTVADPGGFVGNLQIPPANVIIHVRDQDSNPISGVGVRVQPAGVDPSLYEQSTWLITDKNGDATGTLPAGAQFTVLEVGSPSGKVDVNVPFTVPQAGNPAVEVTVSLVTNVHLTLKDEGGNPLANSWVTIKPDDGSGTSPVSGDDQNAFGNTNSSGVLNINLKAGTYYLVEVGNPNRHVLTRLQFVVADSGFTGTLQLPQPSVAITVLGTDGNPLPHAMLQFRPAASTSNTGSIMVETDANGVAWADLPRSQDFMLVDVGWPQGVMSINKVITVPATGQYTATISLAGNVQVKLLDENGVALPYAWVSIKPAVNGQPDPKWEHARFGNTDGNGNLNMNLDQGDYFLVQVNTKDRNTMVQPPIAFTVGADGYKGQTWQLPKPNVVITINGQDGKPLPHAMVQFRPATALPGDWQSSVWVQTGSDGAARATLTAGMKFILVDVGTPNGVFRVGREILVPTADQTTPYTDTISLAANVHATLRDEDGHALPQTWVTIKPDNGQGQPVDDWQQAQFTNTDANGLFTLNLKSGLYHVVELGNQQMYRRTDIPFTVGTSGFTGELRLPTPNVKVTVSKGSTLVPRAMVQLRPASASPDNWKSAVWVQTDQFGVARAQVAAGNWIVVDIGTPDGVFPVRKSFTAPATGTAEVAVSVAANVQATLKDEKGVAIAQAWVTVKPDDGHGQPVGDWSRAVSTGTDMNGKLNLNLDAGKYHVVEVGTQARYIRTDIPFTVGTDGYTGDLRLPTPNVQVTVLDQSGLPIAKAWAQFRPASAAPDQWDKSLWVATDETGVAAASLTAGADYLLVDIGTPNGVTRLNRKFTVPATGSYQTTVSLKSNVSATLLDGSTPIANAWVTIKPDNGGQPASGWDQAVGAMTNSQGTFQLNLPTGKYHLVEIGSPNRYIRTDISFDVTDSGFSGSLTLPAPNVSVVVTDSAGNVLPRAMVQVRPATAAAGDWSQSIWAQTDDTGTAGLKLSAGDYLLVDVGTPSGVTPVNLKFTVASTGTQQLQVSLKSNVAVTLQDETGATLANTWAMIRPDDGSGKPVSGNDRNLFAKAGQDGKFSLSLPQGTYHIVEVGNQQRHVNTDLSFTVGDSGFTGILQLPATNTTAVVTLGGVPVAHAKIAVASATADPNSADFWSKVTWYEADENGVVKLALSAGSYIVTDVDAPTQRYHLTTPVSFTVPTGGTDVQIVLPAP